MSVFGDFMCSQAAKQDDEISKLRSQLALAKQEIERLKGERDEALRSMIRNGVRAIVQADKNESLGDYAIQANRDWFAMKQRAESLESRNRELRDALQKIVAICAPGPLGAHRRLDKVFSEIHDIYTQAMYPEQVAAARVAQENSHD